MRVKYLSGPYAGYEETIENQAYAEQMVQFGYAERVADCPPKPPEPVSPALVEEPPVVEPPAVGSVAVPGPDPAGGPLFDP